MGNSILASGSVSSPITVDASIPQYVADGFSGSGSSRSLTFSGSAPPTDGSVGLAFIVIASSTGLSYATGAFQRLAYWSDATVGAATVNGGSGFSHVKVPTWSFVADAEFPD